MKTQAEVTIATIPAGDGSEFLEWDWKFYLHDGKVLHYMDGEHSHYEDGFVDALASFRPDIVITRVTIDSFDVDAFVIGQNDESLLEAKLAELIPLGKVVA